MSEDHAIHFKGYLNTLLSLLVLTAVTVLVAQFDFGIMNIVVAMFIATIKGVLVLLFFMHLKYDDHIYSVILFSGVFFVVILFLLSKIDIITRVQESIFIP